MKFAIREDIEGPLDRVFAALSDFEAMERAARRRGVELDRAGEVARPRAGLTWQARFPFRGSAREAEIRLAEFAPPERMVFDGVSGGLETRTVLDVVALSRTRTRVAGEVELVPRTLSARLLVQSLKLARGSVEKRIKARASAYAGELERRLREAS
ncbi:SRPBCC family protein [Roseivivax sp. CAU 1761]